MEDVQGVDPVGNDKLPLPPISSLLSVKYEKSLKVSNRSIPPQCENMATVFIPPLMKNSTPLPNSTLQFVKCDNTSVSSYATKTKTPQPMSSPPPPPHVLCGLHNVQTFQQIPIQSPPVDVNSMGSTSIPWGSTSIPCGSTNIPCGSNFRYQQTAFGGVNTLACQTIIYQNTSIISPSLGFKSSICNHPSAWRSTNTKNFHSAETQISPGRKRMPSRNQYALLQSPFKPLDGRSRSFQSTVVENSQLGYVDCVDQLKGAGQDVIDLTKIAPCSSLTFSDLQNSQTFSTGEFSSIRNRGSSASSVRSPVQQTKVPSSQSDENNLEKSANKKEELEVPNLKRNSIFPTCPQFLTDNSSSGAAQHSIATSGFTNANAEFNLFPCTKVDEIESVGSSDLGVDNAEYHPIALPLGCFQCNDSDTESDTTCQEGSLGRRMAKMGQDKFNLHLDKTLTLMDWKLIPIQQEPISKLVPDDAKPLQMDDPRLQQSWDKNRSGVCSTDSTVRGSSGIGVVESMEKEEHLVSCEAILREMTSEDLDDYYQNMEMLGVDLPASRIKDRCCEGPEIKENSTNTENELANSDTEKNTRVEKDSENSSRAEDETISKAVESTLVSVGNEKFNLVQTGTDKNAIIEKDTAENVTISKAPESPEGKEATVVSLSNKASSPVQAATPDHLPCNEVSSLSDTSDAFIGVHQGNPLTRIATVLSQNLNKTSKDKVGKNVERLSRNISCAIQKMKCSSETMTFASVESTQDHESSISDPISYNSTNHQVTVNLPTLCSKDNSSTGKAGCRTQTLEKKELPSLWQDSKSCSEIRQEKLTSNQEKQLLKESADFLGEDFNAFSRRSQRKRGVPKKLENYLSECGDVSEAIQTPVNKRKKQKTKSDVEVGDRTFDSTYNDSSWNRVYQDDVVVEGENPSTNLEIEARYQKKTNENCSHKEDQDIGIDDDRLLKSTLPCTRSMLKRLTSNLVPRSTQKRTRLRSQETQLTSSDIGVNTDLSDDTDTLDNCDNNSTDIPMYSVTLEENSNLPTKGNMGDSISDRTTDLVTPARNRGPVTQNCTVCITREDTIMEGQSLTSGDMITWTENLESSKVSNTGDHEETPVLTTCEVRSYNVHNIKRNKSKSKKSFEKSVSFSQDPAKKKKGRPLKNLRSLPKKATLMGTEANNVSGHFGGKNAESVEEHESAITTELESAHSPLPEKPKKNNNEKREITLLSKGKSKKRKIERMEKSDLPGFDVKENSLAVAEVDTNQSVKKKSKNKNIVGKQEPGGDPTRPKSKKKKSHGKKNSKEKTDDGSLSKEHSSANSLEKCHLKQNYDGKDTSSKKKYTLKNDNDTDLKKKNNSKGGKKALGKISNSQSNNFTKQIHNIAAKNKRRILDGYAKFRIITNPSQGAELMSNRPVDCRFCKETFAFSTLKVHEKEHQFKCIRCCLFFSTKKEKNEHVTKEHKNSEKPKKTPQVSKLRELFHCMLCEKSFVTIKLFQRHLQTSIHGYNRHIQNRCLNMIGSHFHQPTRTKHGTLYAIDNGEEEGEQLLQQQNTWCRAEDKSLKMWTLPENLISIEELEKQFIKAVESDKNVIHYYYREPELLEVIKKQEILLQNVSASSDEERQSEEPYAVVTNFSMMKFLTACTQGSDYVARQEAGSIQCMHNNPADCSTSYTDPAGGSTNYTDPAGGSTNYTDSAVASASSTQTFSAESRSHSLPDGESAGYSEMKTMSHCDTNQTNIYSEEIAAQVLMPDRLGNSVAHNNLSLVPIQSNLDNSYQLSDEGNLPCQLMRNSSRILSTSGSDHSDMDQDQGQMGWLSRAIEDIEADPYYRVHDFLDSQSDMYNVSGFNELSTSKNSPVLRYTSTPSTSTRCTVATDTRSFTDLDSGQQIQVCNNTCQETPGHCGNGTRDIFPVECLDSCRSKESSTHVLGPLNNYSSSRESQSNCKDDDDDPESQELIKLKYAQILCDIRNDVLGTRSGQE